VALCLAVKDQAADMAEWIEWHRLLGVRRMYIFDMGTEPPMNQVRSLVDVLADFECLCSSRSMAEWWQASCTTCGRGAVT
jgi:hypothetical protein